MRLIILIFSILLLPIPAISLTTQTFHPAQTNIEKALDNILKISNADDNRSRSVSFQECLTGIHDQPEGRPAVTRKVEGENMNYCRKYFTMQLMNKVFEYEKSLIGNDCMADICGVDYNVVSCAQDFPSAYEYQTVSQNEKEALVNTQWVQYDGDSLFKYKLLKEDGFWKLDGINCKLESKIFNY